MILHNSNLRLLHLATAFCLILGIAFLSRPLTTWSYHRQDGAGVNEVSENGSSDSSGAPQGNIAIGSHTSSQLDDVPSHIVISSNMTRDGKWFSLDFGDHDTYNPNIIPHPHKDNTWIMVAQALKDINDIQQPLFMSELVCEASFVNSVMKCVKSPVTLPITSTLSHHCEGGMFEWMNWIWGPRDARVFLGPDRPYIIYGSPSEYNCLGQWIHDLRRLMKYESVAEGAAPLDPTERFFWPTGLQRPPPYGTYEKNWFLFWDAQGEMYLHHDLHPQRVFTHVSTDGLSISEDLAPLAADNDEQCLRYAMPQLPDGEHIHQATNSLAITLCQREDPSCDVEQNTYIFTIFHHKSYWGHNVYEPYALLFKQTAPFEMYAVSSKPFWINGRGKPGGNWGGSENDSQMMFVTSMAWKQSGMTYRGYLDDELLLSFGIEDQASGAIDVYPRDLLREMRLCR